MNFYKPKKLPKIMIAPNGARPMKKDHSEVPVTIDEIVNTAKNWFEVGAEGIHFHLRDENGQHILSSKMCLDALQKLQSNVPKMHLQITTEAVGRYSPNEMRNLGTIDENILKKWRRDITKFSPVIKINSKGDNRIGHTAPFPEDIPEMAIKMFSYKGEVVLDPFAGSFTTPKVAAELDRVGVGIEMGKKLFKPAIIKRLKAIEPDMFKQKVKYKEFDLSKEKKLNKQI